MKIREIIKLLFHKDCDFHDLFDDEQCIYLAYIEANDVGGEIVTNVTYYESEKMYIVDMLCSGSKFNVKDTRKKYTEEEFKKANLEIKNEEIITKTNYDPYNERNKIDYYIYNLLTKHRNNGYLRDVLDIEQGEKLESYIKKIKRRFPLRFSFYNPISNKFEYIKFKLNDFSDHKNSKCVYYIDEGTYYDLEALYKELNGNIYDYCCFYGYEFSTEEIKKYNIDLNKINFVSFNQETILNDDVEFQIKKTEMNKINEEKRNEAISKLKEAKKEYDDLKEFIESIDDSNKDKKINKIRRFNSQYDDFVKVHYFNSILTKYYNFPSKKVFLMFAKKIKYLNCYGLPFNLVGIYHKFGAEAIQTILENNNNLYKIEYNAILRLVKKPHLHLLDTIKIDFDLERVCGFDPLVRLGNSNLSVKTNNLFYIIKYTFPLLPETYGYKSLEYSYCETYLDYEEFNKRAREVLNPSDYNKIPAKRDEPTFGLDRLDLIYEKYPIIECSQNEVICKKKIDIDNKVISISWSLKNETRKKVVSVGRWFGWYVELDLDDEALNSKVEEFKENDRNFFVKECSNFLLKKWPGRKIIIKDLTTNTSYVYNEDKIPDLSDHKLEIFRELNEPVSILESTHNFLTIFDLLYFVNYDLSDFEINGSDDQKEKLKKLGVKI